MNEKKLLRIDRALAALSPHEADCTLCPRSCHVDRRRGPDGYCRTGRYAGVAASLLHFGEEPVLSGTHDCTAADDAGGESSRGGSGTIFFRECNLRCLYCQNYQISWLGRGRPVSDEELAGLMLDLEKQGAFNINLVSPTHVILPVLRALRIAFARGLALPIVYNSGGYEKVETVERLAGIIDVYLPDCKYARSDSAARLSGAADYFDRARPALQEMFVQQPDLVLDDRGLAVSGTIVRHLVLPGYVSDSLAVLDWLAATFKPTVALSLMSQYRPCWRAPHDIDRPVSPGEYRSVLDRARSLEFDPLFAQPRLFAAEDHFNPDFDRDRPFRWKPGAD